MIALAQNVEFRIRGQGDSYLLHCGRYHFYFGVAEGGVDSWNSPPMRSGFMIRKGIFDVDKVIQVWFCRVRRLD